MTPSETLAAADRSWQYNWARRIEPLLSWQNVFLFWVLYLLAQAVIRISISRTLGTDDAIESELVQSLSLVYLLRQPPLYEWLLWIVQQVAGAGIVSHFLLRYALVALAAFALTFATFVVVRDRRWAAAAGLSMIANYQLNWYFLEKQTQSVLLTVACLMTFALAVRLVERPDWRSAVLLGAIMGAGLLSKYGYPLFLIGVVAGGLIQTEARRVLWSRWFLLSAVVAVLIVFPVALWLVAHHSDFADMGAAHLVRSTAGHFTRVAVGLWRLFLAVASFLAPWIIVVPAVAWWGGSRGPAPSKTTFDWRAKWALAAFLISLGCAVLGITVTGATLVLGRHMHPVVILAHVCVIAWLAARFDARRAPAAIAALSVIVAVALVILRGTDLTAQVLRPTSRAGSLVPYEGLARELRIRGMIIGTLVAPDVLEAGNIRSFLPGLRVVASNSRRFAAPSAKPGSDANCALIYESTPHQEAHWAHDERNAAMAMFPDLPDAGEAISVPWPKILFATSRVTIWTLVRLDPSRPACR